MIPNCRRLNRCEKLSGRSVERVCEVRLPQIAAFEAGIEQETKSKFTEFLNLALKQYDDSTHCRDLKSGESFDVNPRCDC